MSRKAFNEFVLLGHDHDVDASLQSSEYYSRFDLNLNAVGTTSTGRSEIRRRLIRCRAPKTATGSVQSVRSPFSQDLNEPCAPLQRLLSEGSSCLELCNEAIHALLFEDALCDRRFECAFGVDPGCNRTLAPQRQFSVGRFVPFFDRRP